MNHERHDVVVLGGGPAGVAAAAAAAKNGADTLLVEAGTMLGGELLSGMAIDGVLNARGQYVVGGISDELFAECRAMGGFLGPLCDYRLICYVCCDPEVMKHRHPEAARSLWRQVDPPHARNRRRDGGEPRHRAGRGQPQRENAPRGGALPRLLRRRGPGRDGGGAVRDGRRERAAPAPVDGLPHGRRPDRSAPAIRRGPSRERRARRERLPPRREDRRGARPGAGCGRGSPASSSRATARCSLPRSAAANCSPPRSS